MTKNPNGQSAFCIMVNPTLQSILYRPKECVTRYSDVKREKSFPNQKIIIKVESFLVRPIRAVRQKAVPFDLRKLLYLKTKTGQLS